MGVALRQDPYYFDIKTATIDSSRYEVFEGEITYVCKQVSHYYGMILRQDNRHRFSTALSLGGFHKKV
jgi:hypothetical protein